MKKSILLFAVALGMLTACDPIKDDGEMAIDSFTPANLLEGASFSQYADEACKEPKADGNWIKYDIPKASGVYIYYVKPDGSEFKLASGGAGGVFNFVPARGSDPNQTVYFKFINANLEETIASKEFTVEVAGELNPEIRLLASNDYGKKIWKWDPSITGAVWGNMGYCGGAGKDVGISGNGQWWGVTCNDSPDDGAGFNNQLQHSEGGVNHGDGDLDAYMVFTEDGIITSYDASGNVVRSGSYAVEKYDPNGEWKVGDLRTDAILWPWIINTNATLPSACGWGTGAYEIAYLTSDKMTLVYPGSEAAEKGLGSWSEATFWHFYSDSDLKGMLTGYDAGKDWTWDPSVTGAVWGNMGYCGGAGTDVGKTGNGQWWGIDSSAEFNNQLQHSEGGVNHGDGDLDAYMTITPDGTITSYAADGSVVRNGSYELTEITGNEWKVGELKTDAILWPWIINTNATLPSACGWGNGAYEVVYLSGSQMTLVYPGSEAAEKGLGSWSEATFWHFKAK